jgi:hypothetical protein
MAYDLLVLLLIVVERLNAITAGVALYHAGFRLPDECTQRSPLPWS